MITEMVEKMLLGDRQALARLITLVERDSREVPDIMKSVYPHIGKAFTVGVTGPPGGGKSTLVGRLAGSARQDERDVGIIAVDPTSPFSGGAILGDRIRMQQHYLDEGVFIRSMATRGSHGGLPRTASGVVKLLDAAGKDFVLVETVGVGQTEIDIMEAADTTVVVLVPEGGDSIQTMKAGLMEIADIFVVNKADRPGADYMLAEVEGMLSQRPDSWWKVPVVATEAVNDKGIEELYRHIKAHEKALGDGGYLDRNRSRQRKLDLLRTIEYRIMSQIVSQIENDKDLARYLERVETGEIDPYSAASQILTNHNLIDAWLKQVRGS